MSRLRTARGIAAALGVALMVAPIDASAEPQVTAASEQAPDDDVEQMVGASVGFAAGGRTTPGGVEVGGSHLYRLSDHDWLESSASFTLGKGDAVCFRDREDALICDHGMIEGFAADLGIGVRHHLSRIGGATPFFRLGLGVRAVSFAADDLFGIAVPVVVGAGLRARVAPHVQVVGGGHVRAGLAHFGEGIEGEPHISVTLLAGIEFELH